MATAPVTILINARIWLISVLKCMLKIIKNIKRPDIAIICILALNLKKANIKHAILEINIPRKKKYKSNSKKLNLKTKPKKPNLKK